jgi:two-component system, NtrC family, sensor kinase
VSTQLENDKVELRIKDNGTGISPEIINKIFQPFFTTKSTGEGTGLGLSISYDIVTKGHSGELVVESEKGNYSEFIVRLPI